MPTLLKKAGLMKRQTLSAVSDGRYASRLNETRKEGQLIGLTGIPLFIIENKYQITGAQPIETFRSLIDKTMKKQESKTNKDKKV